MTVIAKYVDKVTVFRNPTDVCATSNNKRPLKLIVAELLYIICIPFAIVSTALLGIATLFSLLPCAKRPFFRWSRDEFSLSLTVLLFTSAVPFTQFICFKDRPVRLFTPPEPLYVESDELYLYEQWESAYS